MTCPPVWMSRGRRRSGSDGTARVDPSAARADRCNPAECAHGLLGSAECEGRHTDGIRPHAAALVRGIRATFAPAGRAVLAAAVQCADRPRGQATLGVTLV